MEHLSKELVKRGLDAEKKWELVEEYLNSLTQLNLKRKCLSKIIVELAWEREL